ncbi:MAG TPA: hypothetical protein ENI98_09740 [Gammaproteobacteria bacterium]|nr:hypothetical protein [Gammaproteobacteria bacterium]
MNTSLENSNSPANRNLNSILSQIQDEGPACTYSDAGMQAGRHSTHENGGRQAEYEQVQARGAAGDDTLSLSSGATRNDAAAAVQMPVSENKINYGIWFQLLLLLGTVALLALTLFRLDEQAEKFEDRLSAYDERIDSQIHASPVSDTEDLSYEISRMGEQIQSLHKEMQAVRADVSSLDEKYGEMAGSRASAGNTDAVTGAEEIASLNAEISSLKGELTAIKSSLGKAEKNTASVAGPVIPAGLTVSLVSLKNKHKADSIVKQLSSEGLAPIMQPAIVNGERVYRLSVGGFASKKEAELFIIKANEKYGMKGSKIRES